MKQKEIEQKFKDLYEKVEGLEKENKDLYLTTQFLLETLGNFTDEPIYRTFVNSQRFISGYRSAHILQYVYDNKIKEIETNIHIYCAELFAYCDTHFILKTIHNEYVLIDKSKMTLTIIPKQFLFSKEMNLTIEGQTLKICQSTNCIGIKRSDND